jgi:hypothetical protein
MSTAKPVLLVVDDEADKQQATISSQADGFDVQALHPRDVTEAHLDNADVVLVDFRISDWNERDQPGQCIGVRPLNGVALAGVLRANAESHGGAPTAFALRSAHLADLSGAFPAERREHSIARRLNLEWVFSKTEDLSRAGQLAMAVRALPGSWPVDDADSTRDLASQLLSIPDSLWANEAWKDVLECHPPLHELSERSHGLAFLRWMLHRILPYPCFLFDTTRLAARLRVSHSSLNDALGRGLEKEIAEFKYNGQLSKFLGQRWWRSGIETFVWNITKGESSDPDRVREELGRRAGQKLEPSNSPQPVICVDRDLQPMTETVAPADAVRIQPDDWPPYADQAYASVSLAREEPSLKAVVFEPDREKLESAGI